jgi:hypothetical protein
LKSKIYKNLVDDLISNLIKLTDYEFSINSLKIDQVEENIQKNLAHSTKYKYDLDRKNIRKFNKDFYFEKKFIELLIHQHETLWVILVKAFHKEGYELDLNKFDISKMVIYSLLLSNIINNLSSSYRLIERGYSQNSDIIFRNYIELSEKSLAILNNDEYFKNFKKETNNKDEELKLWWKTKPSKTFKEVQNALEKLNLPEFYEIFFEVREKIYNHTSKATHGDLKSILKGSLVSNNDVDSISLSLFGNVNQNLQDNLNNYLIYIKIMLQAHTVILVKDHNFHFDYFGEEGKYYVFVQELTDKLFKKFVKIRILIK